MLVQHLRPCNRGYIHASYVRTIDTRASTHIMQTGATTHLCLPFALCGQHAMNAHMQMVPLPTRTDMQAALRTKAFGLTHCACQTKRA